MFRITTLALVAAALALSACSPASADGFLLPVERPHSTLVVPDQLFTVRYHHVDVIIDNQLATTKVDQIFHNDTAIEREGIYIFPMPEGSAITKFSMYAGENEIAGKVMGKSEARGIYESIVRQRKDPALLEYIDRNTFRASVYPIPANGDKRIRLNYSEAVTKSGSTCRYVYPLSTERFSAKPLEDCRVKIRIKSKRPITSIYSPTHVVNVEHTGDNEAVVTWEAKNTRPDTDLVLYYSVSDDDLGIDIVAHKEPGEKGYYMLLMGPRVEIDKSKIQPKNVVFVLDRTGSMAGDKIDQVKLALKFCLSSLKPTDRFNIITFNETPSPVFGSLQKASKERVKKALDAVDDLDATGGTNINEALAKALGQFGGASNTRNYVVFLTDGVPTVGQTDVSVILNKVNARNSHNVKIFSFGVGYDVDAHFLDRLAIQSKGDTDYVRPKENIEVKVSSFFGKVSDPILSDVSLKITGVKVEDTYPYNDIPDIFRGSQLIAFGRYEGSGPVKIELSGMANGVRREFTLDATLPDKENGNDFIPQLWAARKIGYLLDEIRLHSNKELIDEVIRLSKDYGIPTEYTSMLADDRENSSNLLAARPMVGAAFKTGNSANSGSYGVAQSANSRTMKNQTQLPQAAASNAGGGDANAPAQVMGQVAASGRVNYAYRDAKDNVVVVANVQNVARRTFYQRGSFWEDADLKTDAKPVQIKQFSDAHFKLLKAYPRLSRFSTLGNVRLTLENSNAVEIGPDGKEKLTDEEMNALLKGIKA